MSKYYAKDTEEYLYREVDDPNDSGVNTDVTYIESSKQIYFSFSKGEKSINKNTGHIIFVQKSWE